MNNSEVPRHQVAWRALLAAHARLTATIGEALKAAGVLSLEAYDVLVSIAFAPGERIRLSDLAQAVLLSKSGLTRSVDRLAAAGLMRRESCADDGRVVHAVLTRKGKAALERAWAVYRQQIDRIVGGTLTPAESETLRGLLDRLSAAAEPPRALAGPTRTAKPRPRARR
ncbi:MAG: MarR family transcriptional regulator [Acidobacteria bacterium]|nr:MarR family transcriptional regulator [Acidobacteriota bacterium]